jgi:hypothetical protein
MRPSLSFAEQKREEERTVADFLAFFEGREDLTTVIYDEWTAKDVLGHIASWHASFARNLMDAVNGMKPSPFKGSLTAVNERGVREMAAYSAPELCRMIAEEQALISAHIEDPQVAEIAYRKGSRNYAPIEDLEIVRRHIDGHLADLRKKTKP